MEIFNKCHFAEGQGFVIIWIGSRPGGMNVWVFKWYWSSFYDSWITNSEQDICIYETPYSKPYNFYTLVICTISYLV